MKVKSQSIKDIPLLSAMIQDSVTHKSWIVSKNNNLQIFINRTKWEEDEFIRTNSNILFSSIDNLSYKFLHHQNFLKILGMRALNNKNMEIIFYNGCKISFNFENINIKIQDHDVSWHV